MADGLRQAQAGEAAAILARARDLSRSFLGREIRSASRGAIWRGVYRGLAADGGLLLETEGGTGKGLLLRRDNRLETAGRGRWRLRP